jgi:predicted solute-binding protein
MQNYKISIDTVNRINENTKTKLDLYNEIIRKIHAEEDISDEEIKEYLNNEEYNKNNKILNSEIKKIDSYINYYIEELPIIDNAESLME